MHRLLTLLATVVALIVGLSACGEAAAPAEVGADAVVIDVRTPEEYAAGHLEGAVLLDFNGGQFAAEFPGLDPEGEYLVYCRSGNRSGQAIALMEEAGFSSLTDLGSMEQAAKATGLPIVE